VFKDFSSILFFALLLTGVIWLWDLTRRRSRDITIEGQEKIREPVLVEYSKAFFPVILIVFILRSFIVEPFRIPSGSMLPSLEVGDFILVNKFSYGIRLPVINRKVIEIGEPERGDVMVFRYPVDNDTNFIKRVIGLPGDTVEYRGKAIFINGQEFDQTGLEDYSFINSSKRQVKTSQHLESIGDRSHRILVETHIPSRDMKFDVPQDSFFVMGDNRDHSNDSRYWGFVPSENIVGKAFFIWFNWDLTNDTGIHWDRIGTFIE